MTELLTVKAFIFDFSKGNPILWLEVFIPHELWARCSSKEGTMISSEFFCIFFDASFPPNLAFMAFHKDLASTAYENWKLSIRSEVFGAVYEGDAGSVVGLVSIRDLSAVTDVETYAPVARLESIRILLAYACAHDFKLYQMDVKSSFLNCFINEEVYVAQPSGFIDFEKPNHVFKLKKALYGRKQAPKAWYDRLKAFLIDYKYTMGLVDNTLFTKKRNSHIIIVQIYVDDIIFGSTCQELCDDFSKIMHDEFEMSMMGELNFFLGLQIKQLEDGIFFNQSKYVKEMLEKFSLEDSKPIKTPMSSETKLTRDEDGEPIDETKYRGMIGSLLYLTSSRPNIMFSVYLCAHFQEALKTSHLEADVTALAISTIEAEYVSVGKACQQALWMKQALVEYN
ncbi:retrovirus-related pol polyprotein from transposon TNT 1-94 [Tanacetum coccineum]